MVCRGNRSGEVRAVLRINCSLLSAFLPSPVLPSIPLQDGEAPSSPKPPSRAPNCEAASPTSTDERLAPEATSARLHAAASSRRHDSASYASLRTSAATPSTTSVATSTRCTSPCSSATHDETTSPRGGARHYPPSASLQLKPLLDSVPLDSSSSSLFICRSRLIQRNSSVLYACQFD